MPDQRHDRRSPLAARLHVVDIESGVEFPADALDTSPHGLAFSAAMEPALGAEMEVTFQGATAEASLFKVRRVDAGASGYRVAGELKSRWSEEP